MHIRPEPSQDLLRYLLHYNPETGEFIWRLCPELRREWNTKYAGKIAGTVARNRSMIGVRSYGQIFAHRLAWIYVNGSIPEGMEIDHIDGNPGNNAITNLRLATSSEQKQNKRVQSNNRSGLKGAYYHACHKGKKWRSQIKVGKDLIFLGYFHTAEEAHAAYGAAARRYFGEFARAA